MKTTHDPNQRTLLKVTIDHEDAAEEAFAMLMGGLWKNGGDLFRKMRLK